jgi:molybdopterin-guanine dinucleotide biosynthesis protein
MTSAEGSNAFITNPERNPPQFYFSRNLKGRFMDRPIIVAVGGFASEVGKTTLMCRLLKSLPAWEAIKTTRGHYRSCGKDPHACCVSHLLGDEPVVRSGREQTYAPGKDTGRYWDAGAKNVHWMIAAEHQVEKGINEALERVRSDWVIIEGNSFTHFVDVAYLIMVARGDDIKVKGSARRVLSKASSLYLRDGAEVDARHSFCEWSKTSGLEHLLDGLQIYTEESFPQLLADLRKVTSRVSR